LVEASWELYIHELHEEDSLDEAEEGAATLCTANNDKPLYRSGCRCSGGLTSVLLERSDKLRFLDQSHTTYSHEYGGQKIE
jgi:hypothetical protein